MIHGFRRGSRCSKHSLSTDRPADNPPFQENSMIPGGFDVLNASILHDIMGLSAVGPLDHDLVVGVWESCWMVSQRWKCQAKIPTTPAIHNQHRTDSIKSIKYQDLEELHEPRNNQLNNGPHWSREANGAAGVEGGGEYSNNVSRHWITRSLTITDHRVHFCVIPF